MLDACSPLFPQRLRSGICRPRGNDECSDAADMGFQRARGWVQSFIREATKMRRRSASAARSMRALLAGQVALSLILLVIAGLLVRSFIELTTQDIGSIAVEHCCGLENLNAGWMDIREVSFSKSRPPRMKRRLMSYADPPRETATTVIRLGERRGQTARPNWLSLVEYWNRQPGRTCTPNYAVVIHEETF